MVLTVLTFLTGYSLTNPGERTESGSAPQVQMNSLQRGPTQRS